MTSTNTTSLFAISLLGLACAHVPSAELVAARDAYQTAAKGPASKNAKTEVYHAKQALARAERAHKDRAGSGEEIDLAYVALRKADNAIAYSQFLAYQHDAGKAEEDYVSTLESQKDTAQEQLALTKGDLSASNKALSDSEASRQNLEHQLGAALASLSDMANVKQEDQRTIITLSGAVLFKSNETQLMEIAQQKLAQVADVLKQYGDEYTITVNGHTDSRGSDVHNQQLSQGRADSVRKFLVSRGVEPSVVRAVGQGEAQPMGDNNSAEGRANNRRVEIIVDRARSGG